MKKIIGIMFLMSTYIQSGEFFNTCTNDMQPVIFSKKTTFADIAGAEEAKIELGEVVEFLNNPDQYDHLGAKMPKGILLVGPSGTGKTLLARAVAGETGCPFFNINAATLNGPLVGVGSERIRELFKQARKHAPCIIFIDEIDSIGTKRSASPAQTDSSVLNQLLVEMDGFQYDDNHVIIIAATNRVDELDPALIRPGRFDLHINVPLPNQSAREKILSFYAKKSKLSSLINIQQLAQSTKGFSAAELGGLINRAAILAARRNKIEITPQEIAEARKLLSSRRANPNSHFVPTTSTTTFKDVAGSSQAREELEAVVNFLKNPTKYRSLGAKAPRGIILAGSPGNGKTLLARAVAGEAECSFFSVSGSEFVESFVGVGASRVRELFKQAREHSPSIIFIDEIDAIGAKRQGNSNQEFTTTLNQLLVEMDGFEHEDSDIIIIAATNRIDQLDPALLRAGRFDAHVTVPCPDRKTRQQILSLYANKIKMSKKVDMNAIATRTEGFSAADLANLINKAALIAVKKNCSEVALKELEEAYMCISESLRV